MLLTHLLHKLLHKQMNIQVGGNSKNYHKQTIFIYHRVAIKSKFRFSSYKYIHSTRNIKIVMSKTHTQIIEFLQLVIRIHDVEFFTA